MSAYQIQSACECQALLGADLDEHRNVVTGWVSLNGEREPAPANAVAPSKARFDVVWHCPICGRNTLRSFFEGALQRLPSDASEDGAA